jgi:hypothetical protein
VILPADACHVTDLSDAVPWTDAVNASVPPVVNEAEAGEIPTEVTVGLLGPEGPELDAEVTVTVAEANSVELPRIEALIVATPVFEGAV